MAKHQCPHCPCQETKSEKFFWCCWCKLKLLIYREAGETLILLLRHQVPGDIVANEFT